LAFGIRGRASQCPGRIDMRSLLGAPLVRIGKRLQLIGDYSIGHDVGGVEQGLRGFQIFFASSRDLQCHGTLHRAGEINPVWFLLCGIFPAMALRRLPRFCHGLLSMAAAVSG
jgi:hypothetical protein